MSRLDPRRLRGAGARRTAFRSIASVAALLIALQSLTLAPAHADDSGAVTLGHLLGKRISDGRIGTDVGMIVVDAVTGEVLWARQPDRLLQPASNMKIVTAVTTLAALGPSTRFPTSVLQGSGPKQLILQGGGDPLLTERNLADLARRTRAQFPRGTRVFVHVDGDLFPPTSRAAGWVDHYLGHAVGLVQALAIHGDHSIHPAGHAVQYFAAQLRKRGLKVTIAGNQDAPLNAPVIARFRGHTSANAVAVMLSLSESEVAEVLFRQVAIASGQPPTWAGARRAANQTLAALGIDASRMALIDGSGLSRKDRVSPRFLSQVLRVARVVQTPRFAAMFRASAMPVAGKSGTLGDRYGRFASSASQCARGRVQAKTGTIYGTISLSGLAKARAGGPRVFSVIVNHRPGRYPANETRHALDGLAATVVGCWK